MLPAQSEQVTGTITIVLSEQRRVSEGLLNMPSSFLRGEEQCLAADLACMRASHPRCTFMAEPPCCVWRGQVWSRRLSMVQADIIIVTASPSAAGTLHTPERLAQRLFPGRVQSSAAASAVGSLLDSGYESTQELLSQARKSHCVQTVCRLACAE